MWSKQQDKTQRRNFKQENQADWLTSINSSINQSPNTINQQGDVMERERERERLNQWEQSNQKKTDVAVPVQFL